MPSLALSDFLQDFGSRPGQPSGLARLPAAEARPVPMSPGFTAEEVERRVAEAVNRASDEVAANLTRIYEDTLEAERTQHAAELDALRGSLATGAGGMIAMRMDAFEADLVALTTAATARIVGAFLSDEMQKRSIDRLAAAIRDALGDREAVRVQVRGPLSLHEPLVTALGARGAALEFVETASVDISVAIDASLYETRLAEWSAAVAEVLA